jgi:hypothetical protein
MIEPRLNEGVVSAAGRGSAIRASAITVAVVSGSAALVALAVGTPLQFGIALALCGSCWLAADYVNWTAPRLPRWTHGRSVAEVSARTFLPGNGARAAFIGPRCGCSLDPVEQDGRRENIGVQNDHAGQSSRSCLKVVGSVYPSEAPLLQVLCRCPGLIDQLAETFGPVRRGAGGADPVGQRPI